MSRAVIYARFSSDLQNDKSIADQVALCRDVCAREGMNIVSTFEDRAISGSSAVNRPGFRRMMEAAEARKFDVIVAEDMDRIFRDQSDYHAARKRLDFLGISFHTASGKIGKIDGALRALMGELYIENLALHVRRGLEGVVREGRHAGGRAYGYRAIPGKPGQLRIVEEEAETVRRIFADYVGGKSPRDIARELNAEKVTPPRGDKWNASTINGNHQRGGGILLNEIYSGRIVWNKVKMVKDPETGKRLSRPNPPEQHRRADAPHLRIVDEKTFQLAKERKGERSHSSCARQSIRVPRLLSGLLRCASCGGGMTSGGPRKGFQRIQCSNFRENGSCSNGRRVKRDVVEAMALECLRKELTKPVYLAEYVKTYNEERVRLSRLSGQNRAKLESRLGEIDRKLARAVDAIMNGVDAKTLAATMRDLEAEKEEISGKLEAAASEPSVITLHPAAISRFKTDVAKLEKLLARDANAPGDELVDTVRRLISAVVVHATPNNDDLEIEVKGRLSELLEVPVFPTGSRGVRAMVAREGLEPPTPGL